MRFGVVIVSSLMLAAYPSVAAASASAGEGSRITATNWRTHPAIKVIRYLVEANEAAIASGRWAREERATCEPPASETRRTIFRDPAGRIRKFVTEGGSDDSAYRLEHQYDERGRLRFVFGRSGAFNMTVVEHRLYFGDGGGLIWKDRRQEGPGYTFADEWPDAFIVHDPLRAFAAPKKCR